MFGQVGILDNCVEAHPSTTEAASMVAGIQCYLMTAEGIEVCRLHALEAFRDPDGIVHVWGHAC
jgi:hypothetical protein